MTPPILENISTWLVDWSLVTIMGNTTPPRDPNDENDENDEDDEDDEDDKDDKDNKDDIEDDENDDDERHDGATGRPGGHGFLRSRPATYRRRGAVPARPPSSACRRSGLEAEAR
jgi:hypothetical protein